VQHYFWISKSFLQTKKEIAYLKKSLSEVLFVYLTFLLIYMYCKIHMLNYSLHDL